MDTFQTGDKVQLKSGGPDMMIECVGKGENDPREQADCVWFDDDKHVVRATFLLTLLVKKT